MNHWASGSSVRNNVIIFQNRSLPFEFPFYGEDFTNLKITTQGKQHTEI